MLLTGKSFKIAIVAEELIVGGGVATCTTNLASALAKIGYDVTLMALNRPEVELRWQQGLCTVFFGTPPPLRILSEFLSMFDAVIVSNGVAFPFAFEAARHTPRPLIVEWLHGEVKARQCPAVDLTVAVSEAVYRKMHPAEHDVVIPNGVDLSKFHPPLNKTRARVTIIQVAREWKVMNPDLASLAPDLIQKGLPIQAHIVGRNGPASEHLIFHGIQADIAPFLNQADILLHMSKSDSFGIPPIEAMASGVIPIVSDVGGLSYSVQDAVTGYVVHLGDLGRVKEILTRLVWNIKNNDSAFRVLQQNGIESARRDFDILKTARRFGRYIEEKARSLPRTNRSSGYPFSFVAASLYFVLDQKDRYLAAIADVQNASDLGEPMTNWKNFLANLGREWSSVPPATWKLLDTVYSRMSFDASKSAFKRQAVCAFWLAFLALALKRYDKLVDFLNDAADGPSRRRNSPGLSTLRMVCFSLVTFHLEFAGLEIDPAILNTCEVISRCFCRAEWEEIDSLRVDEALLQSLFVSANHPDLLSWLERLAAGDA